MLKELSITPKMLSFTSKELIINPSWLNVTLKELCKTHKELNIRPKVNYYSQRVNYYS